MKSAFLGVAVLVMAVVACGGADNPSVGQTAEDLASASGPICDPLVCPAREHWDLKLCKCVPNPICDPLVCPPREHWDLNLCKCVPNPICDPLVCPPLEHWDLNLCKCVPNPAAGSAPHPI
jgi:hypothetical protein